MSPKLGEFWLISGMVNAQTPGSDQDLSGEVETEVELILGPLKSTRIAKNDRDAS